MPLNQTKPNLSRYKPYEYVACNYRRNILSHSLKNDCDITAEYRNIFGQVGNVMES